MGNGRSKRTRRQARFALLTGVLIFCLVQAVLALLIELWFPGWREPNITSRVQHYHARADAQGSGSTVLFLGSSRFQYGIRTRVLEPLLSQTQAKPVAVFNYGTLAGTCLTSHRNWRHLRASGARPSLAVVEVVPALLNDECPRQDPELANAPVAELDWSDIKQLQSENSLQAKRYGENILARAFPVYGHRLVITGRVIPNLQPHGHRREPAHFTDITTDVPPEKRPVELASAHDRYASHLGHFHMGEKHLCDIEAILADIRGANVPVILLVMPEGPLFRSWYRPGAWDEIHEKLMEMSSRQGAAFISAREWLEEDAFFDSNHLTVAGGQRFCTRLGTEVLSPALNATAITLASNP